MFKRHTFLVFKVVLYNIACFLAFVGDLLSATEYEAVKLRFDKLNEGLLAHGLTMVAFADAQVDFRERNERTQQDMRRAIALWFQQGVLREKLRYVVHNDVGANIPIEKIDAYVALYEVLHTLSRKDSA